MNVRFRQNRAGYAITAPLRMLSAFVLSVSLLLAQIPALGATLIADNPNPASTVITSSQIPTTGPASSKLVSLRSAVKSGLLKFDLKGDGVTTSKVRLTITSASKEYLRVVIPAHEVFRPNAANVQMMMTVRDRLISISPGGVVSLDVPTVCVSTKTIKPPGKEGTSFEIGPYPDQDTWKQLVGILGAAAQMDQDGAFAKLLTKREQRQGMIGQLAIWMLLGRRSGRPEDAVTRDSIATDLLGQMNIKKDQLAPDKQDKFDKGVDEIFLAADLTLKRGHDFEDKAALPQDSSFDTYSQVGSRAFQSGDYLVAEEMYVACSSAAILFGETDLRYLTSLNNLSKCYEEEGKFEQAEGTLSTALKNEGSLQTSEAGTSLTLFGIAKFAHKDYPSADENLTRGLLVREKSDGSDSTPLIETLSALGQLYLAQLDYPKAESSFRRAMAIQYKNIGPDSPAMAECDRNLAVVYEKEGQLAQAQKLYLKALSIANTALGSENPYIATILSGLASLAQSEHKPEESQKLAMQAAAINDRAFGGNKSIIAALPIGFDSLSRAASYANSLDKIEASVKDIQVQTDPTIQALTQQTEERLHRKVRDKWALVVGVSHFADSSIDLKYAAKDARDFADYLVKEAQFSPDHVRLLLDEKATRENILSQLGDKWLPHVAGPDDLVLIYVSSHGSPSQVDVAGVNYLVAYNTNKNSLLATAIPLRDLTSMVKERIHSDRVVLIMDACHSGAAVEEIASKGLFRVTNFSADEIFQGCGQLVICSSQPNQVSWESKNYPNGVFTHYLLEGLRKNGSNTTLSDACQYMKDQVQNEVLKDRGELQTPVLKSKWQGNDLVLGVGSASPQPGVPDDGTATPLFQAAPLTVNKTGLPLKAASKSAGLAAVKSKAPLAKTTAVKK